MIINQHYSVDIDSPTRARQGTAEPPDAARLHRAPRRRLLPVRDLLLAQRLTDQRAIEGQEDLLRRPAFAHDRARSRAGTEHRYGGARRERHRHGAVATLRTRGPLDRNLHPARAPAHLANSPRGRDRLRLRPPLRSTSSRSSTASSPGCRPPMPLREPIRVDPRSWPQRTRCSSPSATHSSPRTHCCGHSAERPGEARLNQPKPNQHG